MSRTQKGPQYERDISRQLSLWWSEGLSDDWFWRTDTSGGRATTRAKSGKATANAVGDLSSRTEEGAILLKHYIIEIKRGYNDLEVLPLLDKTNWKSNHFVVWWKKLNLEADMTGRKPLLIFKRDRAHACIMMRKASYHELRSHFPLTPEDMIVFPCYDRTIYMFRLDMFLEWIKPQIFKEILDENCSSA